MKCADFSPTIPESFKEVAVGLGGGAGQAQSKEAGWRVVSINEHFVWLLAHGTESKMKPTYFRRD